MLARLQARRQILPRVRQCRNRHHHHRHRRRQHPQRPPTASGSMVQPRTNIPRIFNRTFDRKFHRAPHLMFDRMLHRILQRYSIEGSIKCSIRRFIDSIIQNISNGPRYYGDSGSGGHCGGSELGNYGTGQSWIDGLYVATSSHMWFILSTLIASRVTLLQHMWCGNTGAPCGNRSALWEHARG